MTLSGCAIDRRFFRKKYDAQQVLAQFAQTARDETDLDALLAELVRVVDETLQPQHVSIWLRKQEAPKSALASSGLTEQRS
jgi:GAF domain-containing protein